MRGIKSLCTEADWQRAVAAMPPAARDLALNPPLPVTWINAHAITDLIRIGHQVALKGNDELLVQAARTAIKGDLNTLYKIFIRLASPQWVIDRAPKLWETYSRNNGTVSSSRTGERSTEVRYSKVTVTTPTFWLYQQGGLGGVLEATGLKHPMVKLVSGGGTSHDGVFHCSWQDG
jgi:hypothetical protein